MDRAIISKFSSICAYLDTETDGGADELGAAMRAFGLQADIQSSEISISERINLPLFFMLLQYLNKLTKLTLIQNDGLLSTFPY